MRDKEQKILNDIRLTEIKETAKMLTLSSNIPIKHFTKYSKTDSLELITLLQEYKNNINTVIKQVNKHIKYTYD